MFCDDERFWNIKCVRWFIISSSPTVSFPTTMVSKSTVALLVVALFALQGTEADDATTAATADSTPGFSFDYEKILEQLWDELQQAKARVVEALTKEHARAEQLRSDIDDCLSSEKQGLVQRMNTSYGDINDCFASAHKEMQAAAQMMEDYSKQNEAINVEANAKFEACGSNFMCRSEVTADATEKMATLGDKAITDGNKMSQGALSTMSAYHTCVQGVKSSSDSDFNTIYQQKQQCMKEKMDNFMPQ